MVARVRFEIQCRSFFDWISKNYKDSIFARPLENSNSGSYLCEYWTGFSENKTSPGCDDLDECTADFLTGIAAHNCHRLADRPELVTAFCKNTIGTYDCECNDGFSGDGFFLWFFFMVFFYLQ